MDLTHELAFRESAFAWLRTRMLVQPVFTRDDLARFVFDGAEHRLVGTQTGIWKPRSLSCAISVLTAYSDNDASRPYHDGMAPDQMLRYKWRRTNPSQADNRYLRAALDLKLPLIWFLGVGYEPGTHTQVFQPVFPVWIIGEEPEQHQFVVAFDEAQRELVVGGELRVGEIQRQYNERLVRVRVHQPLFRTQVLHAYERRCAICRLPFEQLLDAAHIKADADGGDPRVSNGLALCKIHHGAFDANIIGIDDALTVHVAESVLETFDGPTLQHAIKGMHGKHLAQIPTRLVQRPDRLLLAERFEQFRRAS